VKYHVRLFIWTSMFNLIEVLAKKHGGWPTNSPWDCPNGLYSSVGYYFKDGMPDEFVEYALGFGARVVGPAVSGSLG
jgi:hypothetical protein